MVKSPPVAQSQRGRFFPFIFILFKKLTIGLPTKATIAEIKRYATMLLKYHARNKAHITPAVISKFCDTLFI